MLAAVLWGLAQGVTPPARVPSSDKATLDALSSYNPTPYPTQAC